MTTQIVKYQSPLGEVQLSVQTIQKLFCPKATSLEAYAFLKLCQHQGLNPFLREAYLIKYDASKPASMVVGKDVFTQRAEAHPAFTGFKAGIILDKNGQIEKVEGAFRRASENLLGGWAEVWRSDRDRPFCIEVAIDEYHTGQASWKRMPATMIRKVALVQALREAFPKSFTGLLDASESGADLPTVEGEIVGPQETADAATSFEGPGAPSDPVVGYIRTRKSEWDAIRARCQQTGLSQHAMLDYIRGNAAISGKEFTYLTLDDMGIIQNWLDDFKKDPKPSETSVFDGPDTPPFDTPATEEDNPTAGGPF